MRNKIIGVYKIVNTVNNKHYIGSSNNVYKRLAEHKRTLKKQIHHSIKLQRAINKYGIDNFRFELIEECTEEELITLEQKYFDKENPEYNILKVADSVRGYKHSDATKLLIREKRQYQVMSPCSEEKKQKISDANRNKVFTKEHRDKLSKAHKGKTLTDEHKENIKKSTDREQMKEMQKLSMLSRTPKKITGENENGLIVKEYVSHKEACSDLNIHPASLWKIIKTKRKFKNLIWNKVKVLKEL